MKRRQTDNVGREFSPAVLSSLPLEEDYGWQGWRLPATIGVGRKKVIP